ncbi:MAG: S9 family peptidase [Pseudomonadales bacterium]|nr:S9 family peptidase [Pseudomonadales bacterium]
MTAAPRLPAILAIPEVSNVQISPDGKWLALRTFDGEKHSLRVLSMEDYSVVGSLGFRDTTELGKFAWGSNERIVLQVNEIQLQEQPVYYGELFAVNYDGSKRELIFGYRSGESTIGSRFKKKEADEAWAEFVDMMQDDEDQIMIAATPWSADGGKRPTTQLLNIKTGFTTDYLKTSQYPFANFFSDADHQLRFITSMKPDRSLYLEAWPNEETGWIEFPPHRYGDAFEAVAISADNQYVYVTDNLDNDKIGLHRLSLDGQEYKHIYTNKDVDLTYVQRSSDQHGVYALRIDNGYPSYLMFSKSSEEAQVFRKLLNIFAGHLLYITSHTRDNKLWIIRTRTDTDDGTYYLFNNETEAVTRLFASRKDLREEEMAVTDPVEFDSFDGRKIHGYFTAAAGTAKGKAPMVVLVHGGPTSRDYWEFDQNVQALATQGYSVLRVNFRGSTGYGREHQLAGNRHWGDHVQQDIIAGTRWAIAQGLVASDNICIMGASFGAYSAVQIQTIEPDLFRCAVANAGIYDLNMLYTEGDIRNVYGGAEYLQEAVGKDKEELKRFSPVYHADKIKAPVFIAHGYRDKRAPIEHAEALVEALKEHGKTFEYLPVKREAHGFYSIDNELNYFEQVLAFLAKHLRR